MSVLAGGVISILDHERVSRFAIFGSSYGGIVLQSILQAFPERVTHAIIANTGTITDDPGLVKLLKRRLRLIRILPGRIVTWIAKKAFKKMLATIEDEKRVVYNALVDEVFEQGWLTKNELICHFEGLIDFQLNHRFTLQDTSLWDTKMMIIKSSEDPGVVEGSSEALDRMYPNAYSHVFLNEGHMPSITRMEEYLKLMHEFLEK
jgi:pimeloyl-ACP methyl ester carboxylesterase